MLIQQTVIRLPIFFFYSTNIKDGPDIPLYPTGRILIQKPAGYPAESQLDVQIPDCTVRYPSGFRMKRLDICEIRISGLYREARSRNGPSSLKWFPQPLNGPSSLKWSFIHQMVPHPSNGLSSVKWSLIPQIGPHSSNGPSSPKSPFYHPGSKGARGSLSTVYKINI